MFDPVSHRLFFCTQITRSMKSVVAQRYANQENYENYGQVIRDIARLIEQINDLERIEAEAVEGIHSFVNNAVESTWQSSVVKVAVMPKDDKDLLKLHDFEHIKRSLMCAKKRDGQTIELSSKEGC